MLKEEQAIAVIEADNEGMAQHCGNCLGCASWNGHIQQAYLKEACNGEYASDPAWTEEQLGPLNSTQTEVDALHDHHELGQTEVHCIGVHLDLAMKVIVALTLRVGCLKLEHLGLYNLCFYHC